MFDFCGEACAVCGRTFGERDDVIVCPSCGAPHHRECYKIENKCAYDERHGDGFEWQPAAPAKDEDTARSSSDGADDIRICRNCGAKNNADTLYCNYCEMPLFDSDASRNFGSSQDVFFTVGSTGGAISDGELINDVPVGDLKKFIGTSWYYYIPQFLYFTRNAKKVSLNFTALLTNGLWFISRKMYLLGIAILILMTGTNIFQLYVESLMLNASSDTMDMMTLSANFLAEKPLLVIGMLLCTGLQIAITLLSGMFGNWLYMRHCVKKTKQLNQQSTTAEQFNSSLEKKGGVATIATVAGAILYFGIYYVATYYLGNLIL